MGMIEPWRDILADSEIRRQHLRIGCTVPGQISYTWWTRSKQDQRSGQKCQRSSLVYTPHLQRKEEGVLHLGADGAWSPLFCAAKRSGDFPPNMPWGPVCHVSAVSRGRSPGNCFPQMGPGSLSSRAKRLPAVLARPQSWWVGGLHSITIST